MQQTACYDFAMPNIDHHAPGTFSWIELATSDAAAAKNFYSSLFGWQPADMPMGNDEVYTLFKLEGRDAAAGFALNEMMKQNNVPPHWGLYIATANADETAAKAAELGAQIIAPPFDVFDFGRMAVIKDPSGAVFSIWQAKKSTGIGIKGVPGTLCWADLSIPDQAGADFYRKLFGWEIASSPDDNSGYLHIKNGEEFIGGVPPAQYRNPSAPPHWMSYFLVTDEEASVAKIKELGGVVYMGPIEMGDVGKWAVAADPQGAVFALFEPGKKQ